MKIFFLLDGLLESLLWALVGFILVRISFRIFTYKHAVTCKGKYDYEIDHRIRKILNYIFECNCIRFAYRIGQLHSRYYPAIEGHDEFN